MTCYVLLEKRNLEELTSIQKELLYGYFRTKDIKFQRIDSTEDIGPVELYQQDASAIVLADAANQDTCSDTTLVMRVVDHPGYLVILDSAYIKVTAHKGAL